MKINKDKIINTFEYIDALIKENEELIKENEALTNDYKEMKKTMLDERRQKNLIQKKYQKIKHYADINKELEVELKRFKESASFDKARADRIISRAETVEKELYYDKCLKREYNTTLFLKYLRWIIMGGDR